MGEEVDQNRSESIKEVPVVSLTTDFRTTNSAERFCSFTISYIKTPSEGLEVQVKCVLGCTLLNSRHMGKDLPDMFALTICRFKIEGKIGFIATVVAIVEKR